MGLWYVRPSQDSFTYIEAISFGLVEKTGEKNPDKRTDKLSHPDLPEFDLKLGAKDAVILSTAYA